MINNRRLIGGGEVLHELRVPASRATHQPARRRLERVLLAVDVGDDDGHQQSQRHHQHRTTEEQACGKTHTTYDVIIVS